MSNQACKASGRVFWLGRYRAYNGTAFLSFVSRSLVEIPLPGEISVDIQCSRRDSSVAAAENAPTYDSGIIVTAAGRAYAFGFDAGHLGVSQVNMSVQSQYWPFYQDPVLMNVPTGKFVVGARMSPQNFELTTSALIFSDGTVGFYGYCDAVCNLTDTISSNTGFEFGFPGETIVDMSVSSSGLPHALYCMASGNLYASGSSHNGLFFHPEQAEGKTERIDFGKPCKQVIAATYMSMVLFRAYGSASRGCFPLDQRSYAFVSLVGDGSIYVSGSASGCLLGNNECGATISTGPEALSVGGMFVTSIGLSQDNINGAIHATGRMCARSFSFMLVR
jgi:hypothetical protein